LRTFFRAHLTGLDSYATIRKNSGGYAEYKKVETMKYEKNERANLAVAEDSVEFVLADNEEILWQGKPKKSAYILNKVLAMMPFALLWLAFDSVFIFSAFHFDMPPVARIGICAFICVHLVPFWIWLSNVLTANKRYQNTLYALTSHRILIKTGLVGIDFQSVSYKDIQGVNLKVGVVDKMLKVGDLYFRSASGQQAFFDIENPYEVYKIAQKIVSSIQTDIEFPNAYRPENNPGYNTKIEM